MSQGLHEENEPHDADDDDVAGEEEGDLGSVSYNPPIRREDKKTERQRRNEKAQQDQVRVDGMSEPCA